MLSHKAPDTLARVLEESGTINATKMPQHYDAVPGRARAI